MNSDFSLLRWSSSDGIAVATLDDPPTSNALGQQMSDELEVVLDRFEEQDELRVLILTGAGSRTFCAGANIRQFPTTALEGRRYLQRVAAGVPSKIERVRKPVLAAVNGHAMGGGFALALACDIVIAAEGAQFAMPEVDRGLAAGFGIIRLHQIVGRHRAKQLLMTREKIDATQAWHLGIVGKVVPSVGLMDEALAMAKQIASGAPLALEIVKAAVNRDLMGNDMAYMVDAMDMLFGTEDAREGFLAFAEKRAPRFTGR